MTPKKVPANDLDRALLALSKSKAALPQFLRELGKGELWFVTPFHPEIIGGQVELEDGMRSPFAELEDANGVFVPLYASFERLQECLQANQVPEDRFAAASMEAVLVLGILAKMEIRGVLNMGCATGMITMNPDLMRDVADGSAFQPEELEGKVVEEMLRLIDPADYPTNLLQPVFEILRQHRHFRAAWVMENEPPEDAGSGGRHFQFIIHMEPQDPAVYHELNLVLASAALATGDQAECGLVDETDTAYVATLWRQAEPFYIATDQERPTET